MADPATNVDDAADGENEVSGKEDVPSKLLQSLLDLHIEQDQASFSRIMLASKLTQGDAEAMSTLPGEFTRMSKDFRLPVTGLAAVQDTVFVGVFEFFPGGTCVCEFVACVCVLCVGAVLFLGRPSALLLFLLRAGERVD
jgi:hypothetical protein